MPGPKQGTKAAVTLQRLKNVLQRCMNMVDDAVAELAPVDLRGENVEPRQRTKLGLQPKRPRS